MKVWEALEQLKEMPKTDFFGICHGLEEHHDYHVFRTAWKDNRWECFGKWDKFSGMNVYPVPGWVDKDGETLLPNSAFNIARIDDFWNPEHPYGASRLRLLDHCIEWFKGKGL